MFFASASHAGSSRHAHARVFSCLSAGTCTPTTKEEDGSGEAARRGLVGPGSSPPTCRSRCGGCHPCRPVHVAIQPGRSFPLEYYPEAWRCKCGNKLFMP
jgi:hypothetical protein